jgi:hypothetical protein
MTIQIFDVTAVTPIDTTHATAIFSWAGLFSSSFHHQNCAPILSYFIISHLTNIPTTSYHITIMTLPPIDKRWISNPLRVLKTYRLNEREVIALDHTKYGSILQWVACEAMKQRVCEPKNIVNHLYNKVGIDLRYDIINKGEHLGATNGPWQAIVVCPTLGMKFSVFSETPNGLNEEEESDVSFSEEGGEEEEMEEEEGMEEEDVIDEDTEQEEQEEEEGEEVNSLQLHPFRK